MRFAAKIIATFFCLGYVPLAPGTLASLVAALLYYFWLHSFPFPLYASLVLLLIVVSVAASSIQARALNQKDPGVIVIDEVCGQLAVLSLVPATAANVLAGFILFRIFDIVKPFPVRRAESLPGGWGIMADDLAAAAYSAALLHIFLYFRGARLI
jgi:phosphatidylglycerophosphatase A